MRSAPQSTHRRPADATRHVRGVLTAWLSAAVHLPARRTCGPGVVWHVLLWAAAFARSLAAACDAIPGAPTGQAVWDALRAALPRRRRTLEARLLPALHAPLPRRPKPARVAVDYHNTPYYGPRTGTPPGAGGPPAPTRSTRTPPRAWSAARAGTPSG
jgi:putative transposase